VFAVALMLERFFSALVRAAPLPHALLYRRSKIIRIKRVERKLISRIVWDQK